MNRFSHSFLRSFMFSLFVVSMVACSSVQKRSSITDDDLLLSENASLALRSDLSTNEVRRDIDVLLYALRSGYGGRTYIDGRAFSSAIQLLEELKSRANELSSSVSLCEEIDKILFGLPDNHLHARTQTLGLSRVRLNGERKPSVGSNLLNTKDATWSIVHRRVGQKSIPILSIVKLPDAEDSAWEGFKPAIENIIATAPALIIDIRGNGGGSDEMPLWLASRLKGKSVESPYDVAIKSQTPATFALAVNMSTLKTVQLQRRGATVPEYLQKSRGKFLEFYKKAKRNEVPSEDSIKISYETQVQGQPFVRPVYILVDAGCASSCESLLEFFESNPNVRTVGEPTAGSVHFGNMGVLILPASQVIVQMATDFWRYKDGRFIEKIGYKPQVSVSQSGVDALSIALREIEVNANGSRKKKQ